MGHPVPHSTHVTVAGELRPTLLRIPPKPCCLSNRLSPNVFSSAVNGREKIRCGPVWLLARQKGESLLRGHREGRSSRKPRSRQEGIALQRESAHQASGLHLRSSSRCSASEQSNRDLRRQTHPASCPNCKGDRQRDASGRDLSRVRTMALGLSAGRLRVARRRAQCRRHQHRQPRHDQGDGAGNDVRLFRRPTQRREGGRQEALAQHRVHRPQSAVPLVVENGVLDYFKKPFADADAK